ncbi:hypothetical protein [Paenibacillus sp. HB172176]|uniref:hypothetical protein n=1 Tax=Paenibacillus sp. HB172176 TaxID=2493690 RepID=UPI00143B43D4|nr:hypothetical protein [Paenibacillus sp. HB172176]
MLDFHQKLAILSSFPKLHRKDVSLGRVNFHYEESAHEKKTVVYHLHPNGNGFVYAGLLPNENSDAKGMVNIRDCTEEELRRLVSASIASLAPSEASSEASRVAAGWGHGRKPAREEHWIGSDGARLTIIREDELWYVYAGESIEMAFETYNEAVQYMEDEQFHRE